MTLIKDFTVSSLQQSKPFAWHSSLMPFLTVFFCLSAIGTVFYLFATKQPAMVLWISLTLGLTILVVGGALGLLTLGEQD